MKETQEFTGKNVDAAVKNACSALGVSKGKLVYQVLSAGASGIFGIVGRKDAKIKVSLPDTDTASAEEREGIRSIVDEAFGEETRLEADPPAPKPKPKAKPKPKPKTEAKAEPKPRALPKADTAPETIPDPGLDQVQEAAEDNNGKWERRQQWEVGIRVRTRRYPIACPKFPDRLLSKIWHRTKKFLDQ